MSVSASIRRPYTSTVLLNLVLILILFTGSIRSQFGNIFEQFFHQEGGEGGGHHQQHGQRHHNQGSADKFMMIRDQTKCSNYLCPASFDCVPTPNDCPCPFIEDIKCPITYPIDTSSSSDSSSTKKIKKDSFVCTRAPGCGDHVQKALMFGSSHK
ncbi:hypothetical protein MJO28_002891 [Puccinia striiformis f. sp. tritici]|uniref:Long chronological lifespan protein 2 n=2 Tax=Puccinia striiformis TaxID=27350 RepID=A0A2S4UK80_9BASI|nr:hypothetical protein Pst134EB_006216 [Puccinia striiformis f. sp. tritici]KAI7959100.1 hypothetical protein MJO28_002891 [Puccinia striiformis f. sp. tritici]KAI7964858.1 hypothetical protein MJO29_002956 [Puccinia striiformis f. sp. tritici]KAI9619924.1 hypothetical protein H4Q26_013903 [Puccinia striiformis f. sp. tritici PST-130]POV97722.1 hypothetical protein PSHT_14438 [Puccinia striiformis]